MKIILLSLLVIGVLLFAACAVPATMPEPSSIPSKITEPTPEAEAPEVENELIPYTVGEWDGTGIKTTLPFTVEHVPWGIKWTHKPETFDGESMGIFQIMIYGIDNPDFPLTLAANSLVEEEDTTWVYHTGTFYLTINAANTSWAIMVAALK